MDQSWCCSFQITHHLAIPTIPVKTYPDKFIDRAKIISTAADTQETPGVTVPLSQKAGHCLLRRKLPFKIGVPKVIPTSTGSRKTARSSGPWISKNGRESLLWLPRSSSCKPKTYLIFFSVSCSRAEWQSSISLTKSRFLFSAFSRSCLALSRSCTSCSTCPLPWEGQTGHCCQPDRLAQASLPHNHLTLQL